MLFRSKSPDVNAVVVGRIVLRKCIPASLEKLEEVVSLLLGKVDEDFVVLALSDPASGESSHDAWVGVTKNQVVVKRERSIATHPSNCGGFESIFDARFKASWQEVTEFLDNLDKLGTGKMLAS